MADKQWYKEMAVYQIWPRSFCDGNGDGIGDLWGVLSKLDYIKSLNVDAIWFSPLYPSPNADFGYDISDYMNIHPDYGNLEVFKQVLDGVKILGGGELTKKLTVQVTKYTQSAKEKIEAVGGKAEVI